MSKPTITYEQNTVHKLTVARDGKVRIKVAKGSSPEETQRIVAGFTKVSKKASALHMGTLRGKVNPGVEGNTITLYTDSKKEHVSFVYGE